MYNKHLQGWMKHIDFILLDLICLHCGLIVAYWLKDGRMILPYSRMSYGIISVIMSIITVLVALTCNTFKDVVHRGALKELIASVRQTVFSLAAVALSMFAMQKGAMYSRIVIAHTFMFYGILSLGTRLLYKKVRFRSSNTALSMLVVTTKAESETLMKNLVKSRYSTNAARITAIAVVDTDMIGEKICDVEVVANGDSLIEHAKRQWVDEVFIALPIGEQRFQEYVNAFEDMGVTVHISLEPIIQLVDGPSIVETIGTNSVLTSSLNMQEPGKLLIKRIFDIIGGVVGTLIMVLLALFVIPLQQAASRGPVFFCQERIGRNGKRFKMYKFRSMCMDAEAKKAKLMEQNRVSDGMMFKLDWDPRIIGNRELPDGTRKTGIGEFIRKTSIDEFPQFLNVLKGDMSLVGTRPPTVDEWEKYETHHRVRMAMKPGITGMWQVSGRSEITDFEKVVELDRHYIAKWNLGLDLKILLKTIDVVLRHKGAM